MKKEIGIEKENNDYENQKFQEIEDAIINYMNDPKISLKQGSAMQFAILSIELSSETYLEGLGMWEDAKDVWKEAMLTADPVEELACAPYKEEIRNMKLTSQGAEIMQAAMLSFESTNKGPKGGSLKNDGTTEWYVRDKNKKLLPYIISEIEKAGYMIKPIKKQKNN
jgi:hypothetical protein